MPDSYYYPVCNKDLVNMVFVVHCWNDGGAPSLGNVYLTYKGAPVPVSEDS